MSLLLPALPHCLLLLRLDILTHLQILLRLHSITFLVLRLASYDAGIVECPLL